MSAVTVGPATPLAVKLPAAGQGGQGARGRSFDDVLTAAGEPAAAPPAASAKSGKKGGKGAPTPAAADKPGAATAPTVPGAALDVLALARAASAPPAKLPATPPARASAETPPDQRARSTPSAPAVPASVPPTVSAGVPPAVPVEVPIQVPVAAPPAALPVPQKAGTGAAARAVPATAAAAADVAATADPAAPPTEANALAAAAAQAPDPVAATTASADAAPQPGSPMQQVVQALQSLGLKATAGSGKPTVRATAAVAADTPATPKPAGGVVTIDLDPEHLGRVSVTLSLRAGTVDIRIAVEKAQTLALLDKDRRVLTAAVEAAGRTADVDLTSTPGGQGAADAAASAAFMSPPGPPATGAGQTLLDSSPGQSRRQDDRPARAPQDSMNDDDQAATDRPAGRADGGLYL